VKTDSIREQAICEKMRLLRVDRETARFICAVEAGEIPGDVVFMRDGAIVRDVSAIPLRGDKQETAKEPLGVQ